ncbi:MAG: response regulator [Desulfuromonadaceae bacterium]|nr:response regulator [Desulfuromonadaceae bacterium]MDD5106461.1 response regulator [Desulfuromonadaceae bacterium]
MDTSEQIQILVVDDDRLIRSVLEASLKAAGYSVVAAENGKKALELFRTGYFPIVLTDLIMPEMSGLELCRALREDASTEGYTYVIVLTSQDSKNDIIAGLDAGADEYLIKPVHQAELQSRLRTARRILELERARKQYIEQIASFSLIDPVSGTFNRRYMDEHIPHEIKRAYRYERSLSMIMVSIKSFGGLLGQYGYYAGETILKGCADCLVESVRKDIDWVARSGESEFVILLPEADCSGALIVATRLRLRIDTMVTKIHAVEVKIHASFGVTGFTASQKKEGFTAEMMLERANNCLAEAREEPESAIKGVQIT